MTRRAVLWDLDGTLADSREFHWISWRDTMAAAGVPITWEQFLASFGQRNDAILPRWLGADAPIERIQKIGDDKEALYRRLLEEHGIAPLPGAAEWVRRLAGAGWHQAIASSAPRANVEVMTRVIGLDRDLDVIVSAEDVRHGKPDPEVFLTAAAKLGVPADRCVVVEDADAGIEAARRAGMKCIGVAGAGKNSATITVGSLDQLPADTFDSLIIS